MSQYFSSESLSVPGTSHQQNEDSIYIGEDYIVVSDGMGGCAFGDKASNIVVDCIRRGMEETYLDPEDEEDLRDRMFDMIKEADEEINNYIDIHPEADGMGATVLFLYYYEDKAYIAWCGDSRAFLYNPEKGVKSLTKDHSYVQQLVDDGMIGEDEVFTHPDNNLLSRYVGGGIDCDPEFKIYKLKEDDIIILCSDGLSGYGTPAEIKAVIESSSEIENITVRLKNMALSRGCDDDISIVAFKKKEREDSFISKLFGK